jgi:hypothetical protein
MALREDQVQRYGRQILLREVGGRGQQRLLGALVAVKGQGAALDEAVAYLAAGGSPLVLEQPPGGFLAGAAVAALNPDAVPAEAGTPVVTLRTEPGPEAQQVVLGAAVAFRRADACEACWRQTLQGLEAADGPPGLGSLAALAVQRLVLGWGEAHGRVRWSAGRLENDTPRCPEHA